MYINFAQGFVLPYWLNHPEPTKVLDQDSFREGIDSQEIKGKFFQCPLRIKWQDESDDKWWTLPFDPVISVSGGNNIIRTDVLKIDSNRSPRRGTIKEVWSQADYSIQIAGLFISDNEEELPLEALGKLRNYCEARKVIEVENDLLDLFGITRLAIESYEFAHTHGVQNQQFSIKAYSDDDFSLLIK